MPSVEFGLHQGPHVDAVDRQALDVAPDLHIDEIDTAHHGTRQVDTAEPGVAQVDPLELRAAQVNLLETGAGEIDADEVSHTTTIGRRRGRGRAV
jgi:hypothetical protein